MSTLERQLLQNPMKRIRIGKVVLNIGVGRSGEALERAKKVLEELTGQTPLTRKAKQTIRDFGIHRGEPIGVMVTLRRAKVTEIVRKLLQTKDMKLPSSAFDQMGNCSFGVQEHIEIPGVAYKPEIGIFGMNVCIVVERPGYRVMRRRRARSPLGVSHRVSREEAKEFFQRELGVEVT